MKRFNKNILVFILAALFVLLGTGQEFVLTIGHEAKAFAQTAVAERRLDFAQLTDNIDSQSGTALAYHDTLMDIYSFTQRLTGTRIIKKDNITIAKTDTDNLVEVKTSDARMSRDEVEQTVSKISELQAAANKNGAKFLYCAVPRKEYFEESFPANTENYIKEDYDLLLSLLSESDVAYMDASAAMQQSGIPVQELYFKTDHHWQPRAAFAAVGAVCEELHERYGFSYNKAYADINNYNIKTYDKLFLGSHGKKTGRYFTNLQADDFDVITPGFETSYTEEQPFKKEKREGSFEETVLFDEFLEKDYYKINNYVTYSGGDIKLQIMKNMLNANGKKVLLIRDSYACAAAPFLSLYFSELHSCDMRNINKSPGEKVNAEEYMKEISPDYVILLYSGIGKADDAYETYNFF